MADDLATQYRDQLSPNPFVSEPDWDAASASGHAVANSQGSEPEIWVKNSSGSTTTLTVYSGGPSSFGEFPDKEYTIPAGVTWRGPSFAAERFTDPTTGKMTFLCNPQASIEVAAVKASEVFKET